MASAHLGFSLQWQLTPHDFAFAVAMRGDQPYAVGNFGILRGMPAGRDRTWARETPAWEQVADTGGEALLGIGFSPDGAGVKAAGQLGLMLGAAADSDNWQPIQSGRATQTLRGCRQRERRIPRRRRIGHVAVPCPRRCAIRDGQDRLERLRRAELLRRYICIARYRDSKWARPARLSRSPTA